jgi:hypothetical protein
VKRRRPELADADVNGVPPELAAGPCVEVWVDPDEKPPPDASLGSPTWEAWRARRRFGDARRQWADEHGLTTRQMCELMPCGAPWSARYLVAQGSEELAREKLGPLADVVLGSLPARTRTHRRA